MCGGGGGGGELERIEAERQRRIQNTIRAINEAMGITTGPDIEELQAQIDAQRRTVEALRKQSPRISDAESIVRAVRDDSGFASAQNKLAELESMLRARQTGIERAKEYEQQQQDVLARLMEDLQTQKKDTDITLRQALARRGLIGGSAQIDAGGRVQERFQRGLLSAEGMAQDAANQLRAADEQARQQLLGLAQSGLDATTATQQALAALQSNLSQAEAQEKLATLGDVFAGVSDIYALDQVRKGREAARSGSLTYFPRRARSTGRVTGY